MPLADNSVDVVVGTMVLCSVNDVAASLRAIPEVQRASVASIFTLFPIEAVKFSASERAQMVGKGRKGRCSQLCSCFDHIATLCNYFYTVVKVHLF